MVRGAAAEGELRGPGGKEERRKGGEEERGRGDGWLTSKGSGCWIPECRGRPWGWKRPKPAHSQSPAEALPSFLGVEGGTQSPSWRTPAPSIVIKGGARRSHSSPFNQGNPFRSDSSALGFS